MQYYWKLLLLAIIKKGSLLVLVYKKMTIIFFKIIDKFFTSLTIKSYAANFIEFLELRIPYMSKRATKEIEKIILKEGYKNCFEWGSGSSTLWLEQFMMSIVSVEYSKKWFDRKISYYSFYWMVFFKSY